MRWPDEPFSAEEVAELGALLAPLRPEPSEAFAARLDARVERRFARPAAPPLRERLRRPLLPAMAATATAALAAAVIAIQLGEGNAPRREVAKTPGGATAGAFAFEQRGGRIATPSAALQSRAALPRESALPAPATSDALRGPAPAPATARKVEQSASLALGAQPDRVDDVAQSVLDTSARFDGIVDSSSVTTSQGDGAARFALRFPSTRLQDALAELSRTPHAHVISRSDDAVDVNQPYVTLRRRIASVRAERAGLLRALAAAATEDETLRLKARLDAIDRALAGAERQQRGLDRRISYSRVEVTVSAQRGGGASTRFTPDRALHDAARVLAVTLGVIVVASAALVPLAVLLACAWPLARALRRRRREQALDAA